MYNYKSCNALLNPNAHFLSFFFALNAGILNNGGKILIKKGVIIESPKL